MSHEQSIQDRQLQCLLLSNERYYDETVRLREKLSFWRWSSACLLVALIVMAAVCAKGEEFPKTESHGLRQFPAVVVGCDSPKGLGTAGYEPLMQNLRAPSIERHRDRVTAGNTFTGDSVPNAGNANGGIPKQGHRKDSLLCESEGRKASVRRLVTKSTARQYSFHSQRMSGLHAIGFIPNNIPDPVAILSPSGTGVENGKPAQDQHGHYRHVVFAPELLRAAGSSISVNERETRLTTLSKEEGESIPATCASDGLKIAEPGACVQGQVKSFRDRPILPAGKQCTDEVRTSQFRPSLKGATRTVGRAILYES